MPSRALEGTTFTHVIQGKEFTSVSLGALEQGFIWRAIPPFPHWNFDSLIPHPKISVRNATSREHACSIPTHESFADTNWKHGPWQNGLHLEKENISVIVMLIEDAIVRLGGKERGYVYAPLWIYPWYFHTFFIYRKEKWSFFQIILIIPKKKNQTYVQMFQAFHS